MFSLNLIRYARLKALEDRVLFLEDSGFLGYLKRQAEKSENSKSGPTSESKSGQLDLATPIAIIGSAAPATDPNKRIAELVASLQKKSTEANKQTTENSNNVQ